MAPFDRPHTTFYWSSIVNIAPSCTLFWVIWHWIISWSWNLGYRSFKIIQTGAIRKLYLAWFSKQSEILVENCDFFIPLVFDAPIMGYPSEYCHPVWYVKTRMVLLPDDEKSLKIHITILVEYRRVMDRQMDRSTTWCHIQWNWMTPNQDFKACHY